MQMYIDVRVVISWQTAIFEKYISQKKVKYIRFDTC